MTYLDRHTYLQLAAQAGLDVGNMTLMGEEAAVLKMHEAHRVISAGRIPDSDLPPVDRACVEALREFLTTPELPTAQDVADAVTELELEPGETVHVTDPPPTFDSEPLTTKLFKRKKK